MPAVRDTLNHPVPVRGWWSSPSLIRLNLCIISLTLLSSANGYDSSLLNGLQSLPIWMSFMGQPGGTWLGFINTLYWIGAGISATFAASFSNRYGRKKAICLGYVCLIVGTALQSAAPSKALFMVGRFLAGASMGWMNNAGPSLIAEVAYPSHQGVATAMYMTSYYYGSVVAAWVTFGTRTLESNWAWRIPSLFQLLMPLLALPGFWFVPESVRWMVSVGRVAEARETLVRTHADNDSGAPWVEEELQMIQSSLVAEMEAEKSSGYAEMIRTPGNRHRLLISVTLGFFDQWVGNGLLSYYLTIVLNTVGVTETKDQLLISACLQIWNIFFAIGGAVSVERMGRRKLFLLSAAIMLISYVVMTGLYGSFVTTGSHSTGLAFVPFVFVYFAGYDIALTPLLTSYPCEIWPFRLRSRGLMVTWMSCIIAIIFNIFVNPIALEAIGWKYYIVYAVLLVVYGMIVFFFYPETRGFTLEQMALVFDDVHMDGRFIPTVDKMDETTVEEKE
ncbi:hypothetical protein ASPBRDRAFT_113801 [Aspergillus brasiliensis CBS 101740]|uniref:Major facilitator superfamily (MFS) profile domain-containing protein n=1 Tax=Aspergillus brasiliensis (strain CBS 101740 / IMI 381727 / IBT 21946) TaxID=767769 RepID=A0A1L9UYZ1_ASPBC|nr:hypothetical protein ASPBRDRAFT_113801 [Aspergillus brasiliensis CBS 101740]